jgi:hypothetical protein
MKKFLSFLYYAFVFYIIQILLEIIVRLFLDYTGLKPSLDFSQSTLLIENILSNTWLVIYIKLILSWAYLILFITFCYVSKKRIYLSFINMLSCLGSGLITFYYEKNYETIFSFYLPIIIASFITVIGEQILIKKK